MNGPLKLLGMDIETAEQAQDDKIVPVTVASTVTSDGEERAWFSHPTDNSIVGMVGKGHGEDWSGFSPDGKLAPVMSKKTASAMLHYIHEKQQQGYAIVAWNGAGFDFKMLGALAEENELAGKIVLDMYDPMYQVLSQKGYPIGLKAAGEGLGVQQTKSMEGKDAPEAWANGEFQKVIGYVVGDSQITIKIVQAIVKAGGVSWKAKSGKPNSLTFRKLKTIAECLLEPDPDNRWMDKPIDRRKIVAWIPSKAASGDKKDDVSTKGCEDSGKGARPVLLVISGPSGVGKKVLRDEVMRTLPTLKTSLTVTTRAPRKGEVDGTDCKFVTPEQFDKMVASGDFLEWAEVHGFKYGSSKLDVSTKLAKGDDVVLIVNVQGATSIRKFVTGLPVATSSKFCFADVFITPPSVEELQKRLESRGKDDAPTIAKRIETAKAEMGRFGEYKYVVVNDTVQKAWDRLRSIVIAERCVNYHKA